MEEETAPPLPLGEPVPETENSSKPAEKDAPSVKSKGPRKRTKTGCLTCRKRRIKCGEEKPICRNCVKSSRECEGYGQRVVFRQPVGPISQLSIPPGSDMHGAMAPPLYSTHHSHYSTFTGGGMGGRQPFMPLAPRNYSYDGSGLAQDISPSIESHPSFFPGYGHHDNLSPLTATDHEPNTPYGNRRSSIPEQASSAQHASAVHRNETHADRQSKSSIPSYFSQHSEPQYTMQPPSSTQPSGTSGYLPLKPRAYSFLSSDGPDQQDLQHNLQEGDDEYYDVETGDEDEVEESMTVLPSRPRPSELAARGTQWPAAYMSYTNLLANYRPSPFSSPLNDPEAAQIFAHFITSVAPTIDIFDRNPPTQSLLTADAGPPPRYRNVWTDALPRLAIEHPALLHAMCAAGSYHIASVAGQPPTASFRHYHYAVRRIRKAVGLPHRRKHIGTIAAALLIGVFEVMDAEPLKWGNHIAGARQLIEETNYAAMTKRIRDLRAAARAEQTQSPDQAPFGLSDSSALPNDIYAHTESNVDEGLVSVLMGRPVSYDDFRHVSGGIQRDGIRRVLTETDLNEFRIRCDLYWSYCKQDAYRSLISRGHLVMPYERWGQCPPRAGIGDLDAVYGTNDHLVLLIGRIAEFGARDMKRKKTKMAPANSEAAKAGSSSPDAGPAARDDRPMHRMAPPESGKLPTGFAQTAPSPSSSGPTHSPHDHEDTDTLAAEAESEWRDILEACNEFTKALGPGFDPLPPGTAPEIPTPFGPALQYRTHTVAIIWAAYNTGLILLHRIHPSLPPDPFVAAGAAVAQTAQYSQLICRIIAGIYNPPPPECPYGEIGLAIRGVLTETLICLLYGGMQLTLPDQREWLIATLRDISYHTGLHSALTAAGGCEAMWIGMHASGNGPPYERKFPQTHRAPGVNNPPDERRFLTAARGDEPQFGTGLLAEEGYAHYGPQRITEER